MKRLLSVLLAVVTVFSVTATVYAAENSGGNSTINVAGEYSVASTGEVVSVDVGWEEMSFKYTEGEKQWDPGRTPTSAARTAAGRIISRELP